jgi:alkanesulfonate monooxygenase SsuD/methylene tetrahydromethanopterin reductase-like flavin-dependent oxidoreductase (luciferase family)
MTAPLLPSVVLPGRVPDQGSPTDRLAELLAVAEHLDAVPVWSGVWVPDSVLALRFFDATVLLAALAARTRRIGLGVACLSTLGLRQPLVVAQQWANLDALSGGRMTLAVCPGNRTGAKHERERAAFGLGYEEKTARMLDALAFLRAVVRSPRLSHRSEFLDLDDVEVVPAFTQPHLPVWMVANPTAQAGPEGLRRVLRRVAEHGDGWLTYNVRPADLRDRLDLLTELRSEAGTADDAPFPVAVQVNLTIAPTEAEAVATAEEAWAVQSTRGIPFDELRAVSAIGTPEQCAAALERLHAAGATHVLLHPLGGDLRTQVERASADLLPLLGAGVGAVAAGAAR